MSEQVTQEKVFILHEADKMLPLVERIMTDVLDELDRLRNMAGLIQRQKEESINPEKGRAKIQLAHLEAEASIIKEKLCELKIELEDLGPYFPTFTLPWVEFPSRLKGTKAFLIWRYGDEKIKYYRWPEDESSRIRDLYADM